MKMMNELSVHKGCSEVRREHEFISEFGGENDDEFDEEKRNEWK